MIRSALSSSRPMSALTGVMLAGLVATAGQAWAVPALQLDVVGGSYSDSSRNAVLSESITTRSSTFTVGALLTASGRNGPQASDSYRLIMAITNPDGSAVSSASGSLKINGTTYNLSSFTRSDPFGIQTHGVYSTLASSVAFNFTGASSVRTYDTAEDEDGSGGWTLSSSGGTLLKTFEVDRTALGNYLVQFDLVSIVSGTVSKFAPFSHDVASLVPVAAGSSGGASGSGASGSGSGSGAGISGGSGGVASGVPTPGTVMLMGTGGISLGALLWRGRREVPRVQMQIRLRRARRQARRMIAEGMSTRSAVPQG